MELDCLWYVMTNWKCFLSELDGDGCVRFQHWNVSDPAVLQSMITWLRKSESKLRLFLLPLFSLLSHCVLLKFLLILLPLIRFEPDCNSRIRTPLRTLILVSAVAPLVVNWNTKTKNNEIDDGVWCCRSSTRSSVCNRDRRRGHYRAAAVAAEGVTSFCAAIVAKTASFSEWKRATRDS